MIVPTRAQATAELNNWTRLNAQARRNTRTDTLKWCVWMYIIRNARPPKLRYIRQAPPPRPQQTLHARPLCLPPPTPARAFLRASSRVAQKASCYLVSPWWRRAYIHRTQLLTRLTHLQYKNCIIVRYTNYWFTNIGNIERKLSHFNTSEEFHHVHTYTERWCLGVNFENLQCSHDFFLHEL